MKTYEELMDEKETLRQCMRKKRAIKDDFVQILSVVSGIGQKEINKFIDEGFIVPTHYLILKSLA